MLSLNYPMWFIAPLFFAELIDAVVRWVFRARVGNDKFETFLCLSYVVIGLIAAYVSTLRADYHDWIGVLRVAYFLLWFAFGRAYRLFLERRLDRIKTVPLLVTCLLIVIGVVALSKDSCNYIISWVDFRGSNPTWGIVMNIVGTFVMLRVCKVLAPAIGKSKVVLAIADNSYAIMANHAFILFIIQTMFAVLSISLPVLNTFDMNLYLTDAFYTWYPKSHQEFLWLYAMVAVIVPVKLSVFAKPCGFKQ